MTISVKQGVTIVVVGLVTILTGWWLWPSKPVENSVTVVVRRGDIEQAVLASGVLEAKEQIDVGAQVSGQVTHLAVNTGDYVTKGTVLAQIDPLIAQNDLNIAKGELASYLAQLTIKQAQLTQHRLHWQRQQQMFKERATSKADLEAAKAQLAVTQAELQSINANIDNANIKVKRAETELGYTTISAPIDGTVISIVSRQGQTLVATQTVPTLLKLANVEVMTVKTEVSEVDIAKISVGMPVYFTLIGNPTARYDAQLRWVEIAPTTITSPTTNSQAQQGAAVYYSALFDVPNPKQQLKIGMTAQVSIVLDRRRNVLILPQTALGRSIADNEYEVAVLHQDGQSDIKQIKTGLKDEINIEVLSGLEEGESIILSHNQKLSDDSGAMAVRL